MCCFCKSGHENRGREVVEKGGGKGWGAVGLCFWDGWGRGWAGTLNGGWGAWVVRHGVGRGGWASCSALRGARPKPTEQWPVGPRAKTWRDKARALRKHNFDASNACIDRIFELTLPQYIALSPLSHNAQGGSCTLEAL